MIDGHLQATSPAAAPTATVGLLGGTFDPPHIGHLATAVNVRHALGLERVLLVVANEPWQKVGARAVTPAHHRLAMVRAATEGLDGVEASDVEVRRGGTTYTVDTLRAVAAAEPGWVLHLVVGADAAAGLPTWAGADELRAVARFVVVGRPGEDLPDLGPGWRMQAVDVPHLDVSSTDLRRRAATGAPLDVLVPPAVISYIRDHDLYRGVSI